MTRGVEPPRLTAASVLRLGREGGVAHFPGLARPRYLRCERCSEAQRDELQRLLEALARECPAEGAAPGADRRLLWVSVEDARGTVEWSLTLDEATAPEALLRWWRRAEAED